MNIKTILLINMRENGPELFTLREDYTLNCIAAYLNSKNLMAKVVCGDYRFLSNKKYDNSFNPEIVVFSLDFLNEEVLSLIKQLRKQFGKILVGAGGNFATRHHMELLKDYNDFDFIIRGEGEYTLYETIDGYKQGKLGNIKGLSYRLNDEIIVNPTSDITVDLDTLPFSDRQVLKENNLSIAYISSARGCSMNCSFCCNHVYWMPENNNKWKGRSVKNTVDEVESVCNEFGVRVFNFVNSSFEDPGISIERMQEFANEIIQRNIDIAFFVNFRVSTLKHPEINNVIDLLIKAGLVGVFFGVETANHDDRQLYKKALDTNASIESDRLLKAKGLSSTCGFINFNPYSTIENLRQNNQLLRIMKLGSYFLFRSKLRVYKGTPLFKKIKDDGLLLENPYYTYDFKFRDSKVELISNKLETFLQDDKNSFFVNKNRYYCKYYPQNLKVLLHFYPEYKDVIMEHERALQAYIEERNEIHCNMFDKLLNLVENFEENEAALEKILLDIKLEKAIIDLKALERKKMWLYKQLFKTKYDQKIYSALY